MWVYQTREEKKLIKEERRTEMKKERGGYLSSRKTAAEV